MYKIVCFFSIAISLIIVLICSSKIDRANKSVDKAYAAIQVAKKNDSVNTVETYKMGWLKGYLQCARHREELGFYNYDSDMKRSAYDFSQNWIK